MRRRQKEPATPIYFAPLRYSTRLKLLQKARKPVPDVYVLTRDDALLPLHKQQLYPKQKRADRRRKRVVKPVNPVLYGIVRPLDRMPPPHLQLVMPKPKAQQIFSLQNSPSKPVPKRKGSPKSAVPSDGLFMFSSDVNLPHNTNR